VIPTFPTPISVLSRKSTKFLSPIEVLVGGIESVDFATHLRNRRGNRGNARTGRACAPGAIGAAHWLAEGPAAQHAPRGAHGRAFLGCTRLA
jgi:hypothetical protein